MIPRQTFLVLMIASVLPATASAGGFNYAEALQKSIWFYDAQRSGALPAENRVAWRSNSATADGKAEGVDLTGGWYDAGDHVKFNLPMASSATLLAWGMIDGAAGYQKSGQMPFALANLRWVCDYLIRCHTAPEEFWAQVGDGEKDHAWWGPPEVMPMSRPAYKVDAAKPGTDVVGEAAAALAASSMVFRKTDPAYAQLLLKHARSLHAFADARRGKYSDSIPQVRAFYNSWSGHQDELVWSTAWLFRATGEKAYLDKAEAEYDRLANQNGTTFRPYKWTISWDDKSYGCFVLLATITGREKYRIDAERWLDFWTSGFNGERIAVTPGGLAWLDRWGSLRYAANTAFLAMIYADALPQGERQSRYQSFARRQIDYALGDNPKKRSFVCGFGENPPRNPHHRGAHASWANDLKTPADNRHVLYGALVGGPGKDDAYTDDRGDFVCNEVACDYNAGFTGALAKLVQQFGGTALKDFPLAETRAPEFFVDASINATGETFLEVRAVLHNHTAWPARHAEGVAFRYFADLSDVVAAGVQPDKLKITTNYNQGGKVAPFRAWDAKKNLYFLEVTFDCRDCYPGGQSESRREVQFRFGLPDGVKARWDRSHDYSLPPAGRRDDRSPTPNDRFVVYEQGKPVFGTEPGGVPALAQAPAPVVPPAPPARPLPGIDLTPAKPSEPKQPVIPPPAAGVEKAAAAPPAAAPAGPGIRALYKCNEAQPNTNQPRPWFKLVNDTAAAVPLSEVTIRYWIADDGGKQLNFWCDYSSLGKENVNGKYVALPKPVGGMAGYIEISFAAGKSLEPNTDTGEIQCRIARSDWSQADQSKDWSFDSELRDWSDNPKVTVYRGGKLAWGREPGAAAADPAPAAPAIPANVSNGPRVESGKPLLPPVRHDPVYEKRFLELWTKLHDPKSGYFGAGGLPYHATETLIIEAPDYGHLTTSEAISYWIWLEAKYGHLTGDWSHLDHAWGATEQHVIPTRADQPNNAAYPPERPARYAAEWDTPDQYPSKLRPEVPVGQDPIGQELRRTYNSPDVYGMHWLIDVDNWYGFGRRGDGVTAPAFINTFQRGPMESVWATVPHPSYENFKFGGRNGYLDLFTADDQYSRQWRYTNAPDADARAVQAMFWAHQWALQRGDEAKVPLDRAAKLGDYLRYSLFDKYFKPAGTQKPEAPAARGYESAHYLLGWYYAWGGSIGENPWAWRISCSHAHSGYQNPLAAWALSKYQPLNPKSPNAGRDWDQSLQRQMEFYRWLQSVEGGIAGGASSSWNGRYDPHPADAATFHGMVYDWQPVYHDPPSNNWFGMQAWTMTRVAELYYVTGDPRARELLARWVPWACRAVRLTPDGSFTVPSTLKWSGQPDTWDPAKPGLNAGLHCEITESNRDVGVASSLARALLYFSAGEKRWAQSNPAPAELARSLLDRIWARHQDAKGVTSDEPRADYSRIFDGAVYVPPGFSGKMPNGDVIKPNVRFIDLRSKYKADPAFAQVEAARAAGKPPTFRYHRFWAQVEVALAIAAVAELDTGAPAAVP